MSGSLCQLPPRCLHHTPPVSPPRFMFPVLSFIFILSIPLLHAHPSPPLFLMDPSDPSLLKMRLFPSFAFKDVACVRQGAWKRPVSLSGGADQNDSDLARPHQATSPDASAYPRSDRVHTPIKQGLISKEESSTFN